MTSHRVSIILGRIILSHLTKISFLTMWSDSGSEIYYIQWIYIQKITHAACHFKYSHFFATQKRMKYQSQKCTNNQRNLAHLTFDVYSLLIFKRSDFHIIWKYHIRKRSVSPACHTSCKFIKKRFYFVDFIAHYHIVKLHGMVMIYSQVMHKSCFLLFSEMSHSYWTLSSEVFLCTFYVMVSAGIERFL